jgi:uncharacterized membrane protein YraQ (UPF0718 family)
VRDERNVVSVVEAVRQALYTGAGLLWTAGWALLLGYAFSAAIQVFVAPREAADQLGGSGPRHLGLAMGLGFISSSCSFVALAATRALWTKGASLPAALAFMYASTNLVIELGVLLWIFLGWQFVLALYVGAFVLLAVMVVLIRLTCPHRLAEQALERAREQESAGMDPAKGLAPGWRDRLSSREAWTRVGEAFAAEWRMAGREILIGFFAAGAVAALVPEAVFEAVFPRDLPGWVQARLLAALAPLVAVATVIGSMGNGPLAAIFWQNGVAFAGVMAFLAADFVVPPALKINANYYGWRFALYLGAIFAVAAAITGTVLQGAFTLLGLIPERDVDIAQLATFAIDHTFWLNLLGVTVAVALLLLRRRPRAEQAAEPAGA